MNLTRKPPPWGLAFIVLEGGVQASRGGKQSIAAAIPVNHNDTRVF